MSGLAMMFFQDPSLLAFQHRLEKGIHKNNLRTLFDVQTIPKDSQMREVLDVVDSSWLHPAFDDFMAALQRGKHLEQYRFLDGSYLISIDGSGYFSSNKINCPQCLRKESKKGKVNYEHQIVQSVLMHPDMRQVVPLVPEEVKNEDGFEKQDCETNAGKRLIAKIRASHPKLKTIIVGDGLYSKQPFIEELKSRNMRFILVAKPDDHKILKEWVEELRQLNGLSRLEVEDNKGRRHIYEWVNDVALNGNKKPAMVNHFEYWLINAEGNVGYHNSWVTDILISSENVGALVKGGRCRWKIENETFNTLKNQGYHIEHNYGHGEKHLSMNFFLLNLLAFFMHQIFELTDKLYQECRVAFGSKKNLWDHLRTALRMLIFPGWEALLHRVLKPSEYQ
jgi:hypothetical protein